MDKHIRTGADGIRRDTGIARRDGYVNMLNKYGTPQDNSTAYHYEHEGLVPDMHLTEEYESNGLFAKIIDTPAEEALKHGFELGLKNTDTQTYIDDMMDALDWREKASLAIKWSRLFGGALIVMLINDGRGIDEPLDWKQIWSIDELRVYERAIVYPDYSRVYDSGFNESVHRSAMGRSRSTSDFGMPEYYQVNSIYGQFWVHASRCLVFRNGILPERTQQANYRFWGMPEFIRIKNQLREVVTSHSLAVKLLERSVQPIYSMKGLSDLLATEGGENLVIRRMQIIDLARGILNSIAIDADGENYDFKSVSFGGVKDIIDTTCNILSAVTSIPQTILFGRSPAGQNSTGDADLESYYNFIERIQKLMLRGNMGTLLDVIIRAGLNRGKLDEEPDYKIKFKPLWSLNETEQTTINQAKAQMAFVKAQTAQIYVDMGALDPSEVRKGLAKEEDFIVEELLDDMPDEELWGNTPDVPAEAPGTPVEQPGTSQAPGLVVPAPTAPAVDSLRADDDEQWITVNGTHIPVKESGGLGGSVGKKVEAESKGEPAKKATPRRTKSIPDYGSEMSEEIFPYSTIGNKKSLTNGSESGIIKTGNKSGDAPDKGVGGDTDEALSRKIQRLRKHKDYNKSSEGFTGTKSLRSTEPEKSMWPKELKDARAKSYEEGQKSTLDTERVKEYTDRFVGQTTYTGLVIREISEHAFNRIAKRHITPDDFDSILSCKPIPGDRPDRDVYWNGVKGVVVDWTTGTIISGMRRREGQIK